MARDQVEVAIRVEQDRSMSDRDGREQSVGEGDGHTRAAKLESQAGGGASILLVGREQARPRKASFQSRVLGLVARSPEQLELNHSAGRARVEIQKVGDPS